MVANHTDTDAEASTSSTPSPQQEGILSVVPGFFRASNTTVVQTRPPFLTTPTPKFLYPDFKMFAL
jgi:hypothetical protein